MPDDELIRRLRLAKRSDLEDLLRILKLNPDRFLQQADESLIASISSELRSAAGNSLLNLRRKKHEFPYKQIVVDVADKLHPSKIRWTPFKLHDEHPVEEIEDYVSSRIQERISQWLARMRVEERAALAERIEEEMRRKGYPETTVRAAFAGVLGGTVSGVILSGIVTPLLLGSLWTTVFGFSLAQLLVGGVIAGGPLGIAMGAAAVLTSPSYSKTIPAVYRLLQIRRSLEEKAKL